MDFRLVVRALRRTALISLLAVLALGAGIGLPTAMYGMMAGLFLRGLPVRDGDRIMNVERIRLGDSGDGTGAAARDYLMWRDEQRSFTALGAFTFETVTMRSDAGTDRVSASRLTPEVLGILEVLPVDGRAFDASDYTPDAPPVVLIGHHLWRDRFAQGGSVLDRSLVVDGVAHDVIGVMPQGFLFPNDQQLWMPLRVDEAAALDPAFPTLQVMGRLRDGTTIDEARGEFRALAARAAQRWPDTNEEMTAAVKPFTERYLGATPTKTMWVFLAAVSFVLIIACINVANLLLVRSVHRTREFAVRAALGASRGRVARQLFLESGVLAAAGGIAGTIIAFAGLRALQLLLPPEHLPYWAQFRLDGAVLLFALFATGTAAILAGVLPAWRSTRGDLTAVLRDEARGSTGLRVGRVMHGLVVLELALSLGLLATTGLIARSVVRVQPERLGLPATEILTAAITLPAEHDDAERAAYWDGLLSSLAAEPEATSVALTSALPATRAAEPRIPIEGRTYADDDAIPFSRAVAVSPAFFDVFDAAVVEGRTFGPEDRAEGVPVAVVNRAFVRTRLNGEPAIGQRIRVGTAEDSPWRTIVGIVPDLYAGGLDVERDRNPPAVYVPFAQGSRTTARLAIRTRGEPLAFTRTVRAASLALAPDVPVHDVATHARVIFDNSWFFGLGASILAVCGFTALLLAGIGLYGVIAFSVQRRTREVGIRVALGATPPDIVRIFLRRGMPQIATGVAIGLVLAFLLGRSVSSMLFGVSPADPLVLGGSGAALAAVSLIAILLPALRAARIDPLDALRAE